MSREAAKGGALSAARARHLGALLDGLAARTDAATRIGYDPVELPRRYADPADAEVAGLIASCLAYGRADLFKPVVERILAAMGESPARFSERFAEAPDRDAFAFAVYRFNRPADVRALVAAIGHARREHGSLGARFAKLFREEGGGPGALRAALARFARELREAPPVASLLRGRGGRGLLHLLPDAGGAGACKRLNLYLRWMVRGPDRVDLGLWRGIPASALLIPLDTHLHRIGALLGLTARGDASWRTAEEITAGLRAIDPADPVRFDFALCHLGMSGECPARREPGRCEVCGLATACGALRGARGPRRGAARRGGRSARAGRS
ncbi:MAG TPA: TIGR02757 family protein [Anaeromyxobacteraceae bacterium]|nr:TIGR02757 family protein [Anaeromyxobacteraceae bacterium]